MRILVTGDWQTKPENLARLRRSADAMLEIVRREGLRAAVFAGDLKDAYDPIRLVVIDFWRELVQRLLAERCMPIALLGNHDRASLTHDGFHWLPVLRDMGAQVFAEPGVYPVDGARLHMLPYSRTPEDFQAAAERLRSFSPDPAHDVLIFHETFRGAAWNTQSEVGEDEGYSLSALEPDGYRYIVGGDLHGHQRLRPNAWYVGSPIPHTWGEANQNKRFCVITGEGIDFPLTGAAPWFDPSKPLAPGFERPADWTGSSVRLHVPVGSGPGAAEALAAARAEGEAAHPGAQVVIVPEPVEGGGPLDADTVAATEADIIAAAIAASDVPDDERVAMRAWINNRLEEAGPSRRSEAAVPRRVKARNFLCFEELDVDLGEPGITVVTGVNLDRPGKSNGAGKTSLLNALPVALFGRTFKGQQADAWATRGRKRAMVSAELELPGGGILRAERKRLPSSTRLYLNDDEISAGGKQRDVAGDIERFAGYSWDTFAATVFLSQEEIGAFLWGTPKQRHELAARLQNIDRFEAARDAAAANVRRAEREAEEQASEVSDAIAALQAFEEAAGAAAELERAQDVERQWERRVAELRAAVPPEPDRTALDAANAAVRAAQNDLDAAAANVRALQSHVTACQNRAATQRIHVDSLKSRAADMHARARALRESPGNCPACGRAIEYDPALRAAEAAHAESEAAAADNDTAQAQQQVSAEEGRAAQAQQQVVHAQAGLAPLEQAIAQRRAAAEGASEARTRLVAARTAAQTELRSGEASLSAATVERRRWESKAELERGRADELRLAVDAKSEALNGMRAAIAFAHIGVKLLSRDGIPAALLRGMVPRLNAAADRYAELFTDSEIRVRFETGEDGMLACGVLNPHGGEHLADQSAGESRIAALVTSFALREAAGLPGMLILDEPCAGLDAESARAFAAGLGRIAGTSPVWIVTHDTALAAELPAARRVQVTKRGGIATAEVL